MNNTDTPPGNPAILDMEASGLGRRSYPIEVGVVLADGRSYCSLIQPESDWTHWDESAQTLHGITREVLHQHGRPALEVAQTLNAFLQGLVVYSDGWANDYTWLGLLFDAAGLQPRFKLDNLRALLTEPQAQAWHQTKDRVSAEAAITRHRASNDARLLQLTVQRVWRDTPVH